MKYPYDIISYVRNKTFSIEARFFNRKAEDDKPLQVFDDTFSRFVMTVISDGTAATCNVPIEDLEEIRMMTDYAFKQHMDKKTAPAVNDMPNTPAYTMRFAAGTLKGKTPVDVLLENGENAKDILNGQYKWLSQNLEKYPANKKLMDAISEAAKIDISTLKEKAVPTSAPIEILRVDCRPRRVTREDGKRLCYEARAEWDSSKKYPISVCVTNYYAPVETKENGLLNVIISQKDKTSEVKNEFNMTVAEWLNAVKTMETIKDSFMRMHLPNAFKTAKKAEIENRVAAKKVSTQTQESA